MKVSTQFLVGLTKLWWAGWEQQHASLQMVFPQPVCTEAWAKLVPGLGRLVPTTLVPDTVSCLQRQEQIIPTTYSDAFKIGRNIMVWNVNHMITCQQWGIELIELKKVASCFLFFFFFLLRILLKWNTPTCVPSPSQPKKAPWNFQDNKPFSQFKFQDQELRPVFPLLDKLHVVLALLWLFFFFFIYFFPKLSEYWFSFILHDP